ncbi:MAG TPA: ABC transporter ATP-binding protein [Methylomirabilota bacterium]|jgi:phospholipid/cholesterol/gamma-HCH transport system ATP-binding protein|nr:ABC transporter ATP-binding protein [Methylomirabilota bacterium]
MPTPPIVELRDVRKSFDANQVLRGVSLTLDKGTTLAVMGGSGAGKTVLLRIIDGLISPDSGEVSLFGNRIDRLREEQMLPLRRRTGFVFQGAALFDSLSVFENVAFPLREHTNRSLGEITDRVHRLLSLVGLPDTDSLLPAELSGGMRKRVGIARALVMEPEVVFFDEPTAGLDPTNARVVGELIAQLRTGVCDTAIVVTHDIEFADMVADQMAILHQGRIADIGTPAEVHRSANPDVRKFLAGEARAS